MNKLTRVVLSSMLVAAGAFSSAAMAQWYVGASAGQSDYKVDCTGMTACDTKDTGYKLFGGYMFTPNLGIEGGWVDFGKATGSGTVDIVNGKTTTVAADLELKSDGFFLAGLAVAPFGNASVFGKIGIATLDTDLTVTSLGVSGTESQSHTDLFYGVGAGYNFTKNFGVRVEWERFRFKILDEKDDVDLLSVGVTYRF